MHIHVGSAFDSRTEPHESDFDDPDSPPKVLNQRRKILIRPPSILNRAVKVLIQPVKTLNQDANIPIQVRIASPEIVFINQWGYGIV
jgi:hypothetical protein